MCRVWNQRASWRAGPVADGIREPITHPSSRTAWCDARSAQRNPCGRPQPVWVSLAPRERRRRAARALKGSHVSMDKIWEFMRDGAPFSFVNAAILAFVIAIIADRFVHIFSKHQVNGDEFMAQIRKLVQAGNIDRAIKLCEAAPLPLLQVVKAGLSQVNRGEDAVIAQMEERMSEVIPQLEKRIGALWSLANIATLVGLLGTISGLIKSFAAVAFAEPAQKSALLSRGISEAMYNTALGLGIAVLCMLFHLILHSWAKKIRHDLERTTMRLENLLTLKRE
jgi:biopolymer transport protein ExbB/TolQ